MKPRAQRFGIGKLEHDAVRARFDADGARRTQQPYPRLVLERVPQGALQCARLDNRGQPLGPAFVRREFEPRPGIAMDLHGHDRRHAADIELAPYAHAGEKRLACGRQGIHPRVPGVGLWRRGQGAIDQRAAQSAFVQRARETGADQPGAYDGNIDDHHPF